MTSGGSRRGRPHRLFAEAFGAAGVTVESYGNVLSTTAFLHRLGVAELRRSELDLRDPDFELIIGVRAIKQAAELEQPLDRDARPRRICFDEHGPPARPTVHSRTGRAGPSVGEGPSIER